jgi:hypothetical protein
MLLNVKVEYDLVIEGSDVVLRSFVVDEMVDEHKLDLYEFLAEALGCYDVDVWGSLRPEDITDLKQLISDLDDAVQFGKELLAKATA